MWNSSKCQQRVILTFKRWKNLEIPLAAWIVVSIVDMIVMIAACGATSWSSSTSSSSSSSTSSSSSALCWHHCDWLQPAVRHRGLPSSLPLRAAALLDKTDLCPRYWKYCRYWRTEILEVLKVLEVLEVLELWEQRLSLTKQICAPGIARGCSPHTLEQIGCKLHHVWKAGKPMYFQNQKSVWSQCFLVR